MIHPSSNSLRQGQSGTRRRLLLPVAGIALLLSSCSEVPAKPLPPAVTDTAPVGEGLKVVGFALLGSAVVVVLGRMAAR